MFKAIAGVILFTCLTIVNIGCLWVLKIMLNELITDDITEKVRKWYGTAMERIPKRIKESCKRMDSCTDRDSESIHEWRD